MDGLDARDGLCRTELALRLPNSPGALAGVCRLLADERVNILALALDTGGQLRLVVDNPVRAASVLRDEHHQVTEQNVVFTTLPNGPGAVAPVLKLLAAGVAVGLGTDGPAGSNNDLNLFEEMDLAGKLQKVSSGDPKSLPAEQIFAMATTLGAKALGLQGKIGSLEAGKLADFITVDLEGAHALPMFNVYSQLVYALKASDVRDVGVNGRLVVRDRNMLTLDPTSIRAKTMEIRQKVVDSIGTRK